MVVLHGDAGVGKSKGAQKFLRDHPTNAVGISITPSTGTLNGSIKLLARALRVPECRNKMDQMMALRSALTARTGHRHRRSPAPQICGAGRNPLPDG